MNDAPLSVLLLAWDEADPAPDALGAPLPAGAALRAQLAAQVALTAILPQQPAGAAAPAPPPAAPPPTTPKPAFDAAPPAAALSAADPAATLPAAPARELLPELPENSSTDELTPNTAAPAQPAAPVLIGLADFTLPELDAEIRRRGGPALPESYAAGEWRRPAAPYVGSSIGEINTNLPASTESKSATSDAVRASDFSALTAALTGANGAGLAALLAAASIVRTLESADDHSAEAPSLPTPAKPAFDLSTGPGPAATINPKPEPQPEPALARPAALAALRRPAAAAASAAGAEPSADTTATPVSSSKAGVLAPDEVLALAAALSFRVIQYARFTTQLTAGNAAFSVVLALGWPTWLAAVEIRQRTGRPLVLYAAELPSEQAPRAARGWLQELERQAFLRADVVLVPSAALAAQLNARYPRRPAPLVLAGPAPSLPAAPNPVLTAGQPAFAAAVLAQLRAAAAAVA